MRFYSIEKKASKNYFIFLQGVSLSTGSYCTVEVRGTTDALICPNSCIAGVPEKTL